MAIIRWIYNQKGNSFTLLYRLRSDERLITKQKFPYKITPGSSLNFKAKTTLSNLSDYFPLDFNVSESEEDCPSYRNCTASIDALFHFGYGTLLSLPESDVLGIRITVLNDATLIGFRTSHYMCDAEGIYNIAQAYTDLISGKQIPDLVAPVISPLLSDITPDTTTTQSTGISTGHALILRPNYSHNTGILVFIQFAILIILQMIWDKLGLPNSSEQKYIYLSDKLIAQWKDQCQHDLDVASKAVQKVENHDSIVKISKLDVLVAWHIQVKIPTFRVSVSFRAILANKILQKIYANFPDQSAPHPINLIYPFSNRNPRPQESITSSASMLGNSQYHLSFQFPSLNSLQTLSHSAIARSIRLGVVEAKKPETILGHASFWKAHRQHLIGFGSPGSRLGEIAVVSSWSNLRFESLDFRKALSTIPNDGSVSGDDARLGRVIFTHPATLGPLGISTYPVTFVMRDARLGGYWLKSRMHPLSWRGHEN